MGYRLLHQSLLPFWDKSHADRLFTVRAVPACSFGDATPFNRPFAIRLITGFCCRVEAETRGCSRILVLLEDAQARSDLRPKDVTRYLHRIGTVRRC